jgi:hypothetical protein
MIANSDLGTLGDLYDGSLVQAPAPSLETGLGYHDEVFTEQEEVLCCS